MSFFGVFLVGRMKKLLAILLVVSVSTGVHAGAFAQSISGVTGEQLKTVLEEAGLSPQIFEDAQTGAPVGSGTAGEFKFFVRALDCGGDPLACENLLFFANFPLGRSATQQDFQIVNGFNESKVFGRAYVLKGGEEVGVDYVIELSGGVSEEHLSDNISRWGDVVAAFVNDFRAGYAGS